MSIIISENSFYMLRIFWWRYSSVYEATVSDLWISDPWMTVGAPQQDNLFPDIIKVGSMKMSGYLPDFDKMGHWCLLSFSFAVVLFLATTLILNTAAQIRSLAEGALNWICKQTVLSTTYVAYMTFMLTCLNFACLGEYGIFLLFWSCFWFTDRWFVCLTFIG